MPLEVTMKIPRGLEKDPIWVKYYEMFTCYLELREMERVEYRRK